VATDSGSSLLSTLATASLQCAPHRSAGGRSIGEQNASEIIGATVAAMKAANISPKRIRLYIGLGAAGAMIKFFRLTVIRPVEREELISYPSDKSAAVI
jgi:hypothetical protein